MNPTGDPLAALRDIQLPAPVSGWPPAPGWWALSALTLAALAVGGAWLWRLWRRGSARRSALAEIHRLADAYRSQGTATDLAANLSVLLRRLALVRFPHERVAGLTGEDWLAFLDRTGGGERFTRGAGRVLATAPYARTSDVDAESLLDLAGDWIRHRRRRERAVRR
jgi:Domain of unknown function (DUF4381)